MRYDNIDAGPDPRDIQITWLPDEPGTIRVSPQIEPEASRGYSLAEEPAIALLPDGRLWMNMRTVTGRIWYTVSEDHGHSWRPPAVLRYRDNGAEVLHPKSPDPIYRTADDRYLLFYHNHDGYADGATGPWDMDARRPLWMTLGEFRPAAHQPLWFSEPRLLCDTQKIGVGVTGTVLVGDVRQFHRTRRKTHLLVHRPQTFCAGALHHGRADRGHETASLNPRSDPSIRLGNFGSGVSARRRGIVPTLDSPDGTRPECS